MLDIATRKWYILNTGREGVIIVRKSSFTLVEIIIVIIVIAILYSIAIPSHEKLLEKNKAEAANFNLVTIYNAQRRYKLDEAAGQYFVCGALCDLNALNNALGVYISDTNFTYGIVADAVGGFKATAKRAGGTLCKDKTMTVTGASSTVTKECSVW